MNKTPIQQLNLSSKWALDTRALSSGGRVVALDTLRGIALLMVICAHFLPGKLVFGLAANVVLTMGKGGVILFFC